MTFICSRFHTSALCARRWRPWARILPRSWVLPALGNVRHLDLLACDWVPRVRVLPRIVVDPRVRVVPPLANRILPRIAILPWEPDVRVAEEPHHLTAHVARAHHLRRAQRDNGCDERDRVAGRRKRVVVDFLGIHLNRLALCHLTGCQASESVPSCAQGGCSSVRTGKSCPAMRGRCRSTLPWCRHVERNTGVAEALGSARVR